ncbi:MAG: tripartite tricarboxylate transporter substrate binding protein [Betaproteobacteria bacterium]|nr:tripartite tricarboxylate transporter substrate binding protein [Betaproteobacteria bacterium]
MRRITRFAFSIALAGIACAAAAQQYPGKALRIIVPFAAGGTTDILARIVGERLSEQWGQPVIVDNRPGAAGNIAAELAARSAPDGHTLFLGSMGTQSMNVSLYSNLAFDPAKDFAPVSLIANSVNLLLVHPSVPASSVKQMIELARSKPGRLNYASSGAGSFNHMSAELFKMMAKVDMVHIAYKGGPPALTAVVSGEADLIFITVAPALPFVKSGKLRALAICAAARHPMFPRLPTASESGLPGFEVSSWYGILVPAATPKNVVAKLNGAMVNIVKSPAASKRLVDLGFEPVSNSPEEFAGLIRRDTAKWAKVIKATGAKGN